MPQEFQNPDENAKQDATSVARAQLGQFQQDQNSDQSYPSAPAQFLPPQNQGYGSQASQQPYQAPQPYGQNLQQQPQPNPYQQNPYSQQQSFTPTEHQPNPYAGQTYPAQNQYQQAPQSQYQYPTGYGQQTQQYPQRTLVKDDEQFLSYDQKASRMVSGVFGAILLSAVISGIVWFYHATHLPPVAAPTAYTTYYASDGGFAIAQPVGWNSAAGGMNGVDSSATFSSGKAKIYAHSSFSGSLMGDRLNASNTMIQSQADELGKKITLTPPVVTFHRQAEADVAAEYTDYHEQPMQPFVCPLGAGWSSEFTAKAGTLTGSVHGYRATVLSTERLVSAVLVCRESDWPTLQPVYMHELQSLDRGKSSN